MNIDSKSKNVLNFRPRIDFTEPDQKPSSPNPKEKLTEDSTLVEVELERQKIKALADAVAVLAELVQTEIDTRSDEVTIQLDPNVDAAAIQAMSRLYPGADPNKITFDHFRQCEENLRKHGEEIGKQALFSGEDILKAQEELKKGNFPIGGLGTKEATNGGLRPELDKRNQIVKPVNMGEFQDAMLKTLVNTLWKSFILPILKPVPIVGSAMPEELVPLSSSEKKMQQQMEQQGASP